MILNLTRKCTSDFPYLTFGELDSTPDDQITWKLGSNLIDSAKSRLKILNNFEFYKKVLEESEGQEDELTEVWKRFMQDIDWENKLPMRYSDELEKCIFEIANSEIDDIMALKLIGEVLKLNLEYVNLDTDSVRVSDTEPYCTKRMVRYFPEMLVKIPKSEYYKLKKQNKWLAIKSGNQYFKNKYL